MTQPAWTPSQEEIEKTNLFSFMKETGHPTYDALFQWSTSQREVFWKKAIGRLGIIFKEPPKKLVDLTKGVERPQWLPGARLNIADSCFRADPQATAILYQKERGPIQKMTYAELDRLSNRVANGLLASGFQRGDKIAIDMTMTAESVGIYLGIVKAGCAAVSIADSFAPDEIKTRIEIAGAKGIFTQDVILRAGKEIPLYTKIGEANCPKAIVLPYEGAIRAKLRTGDISFQAFLAKQDTFTSVGCAPHDHTNILFSSGTTGEPKAIPWSHTTPIKGAMDGHFHHDIHPGEVVAWPTNLGWMMGPWLIYATLVNQATIALFYGAPTTREFGEFIAKAKVNMLGLVPSLVKTWRNTKCMEGLDWKSIKCFSSTGECSNADDYAYLMGLANNRPVVEYCGGTEIGGGFATQALVQPAYPSTFSTPALGLELEILDGELFIVPPSIGLSTELLNRDHFKVYYEGCPKNKDGVTLRRHGDEMERLPNGYYRALGRADDTMNLGGIKVSSAEIERVLNKVDGVSETAAIAVNPPGGGPSLLVIFCVPQSGKSVDKTALQKTLSSKLNPLFKIHDVAMVDTLPRTASNKVMRRVLRDQYKG